MRRFAYPFVFILLSASIFFAIAYCLYIGQQAAPAGTVYSFATGHAGDYYQYLFMIREGQEGHIFFHNAYTEIRVPDVLLQPLYPVLGYLSRPTHVSPMYVYLLARFGALAFLFVSLYICIDKLCKPIGAKILALVLFFSSTGYWYLAGDPKALVQVKQILYSYYFDIFTKFVSTPPHHYLAVSFGMMAIVWIARDPKRLRSTVGAGILLAIAGILHPWMEGIFLIIVTAFYFIEAVSGKEHVLALLKTWVLLTAIAVTPLVYMFCVITRVLMTGSQDAAAGFLYWTPRTVTVVDYLKALGPLVLPALCSVWYLRKGGRAMRMIFLWAFVPFGLFFLPDVRIPMNEFRLFQIYQHIPLAILAAWWLHSAFTKTRGKLAVLLVIGISFGLYGYASLVLSIPRGKPATNTYNYYVPTWLWDVFWYLNRTPADSVVLAGTTVSSMIPAFTHNKVIVGHDGNQRDYARKYQETYEFFYGQMPTGDIPKYVKQYSISYIVFGVDIPAYNQEPYYQLPLFTEVYHDASNTISIIRVGPPDSAAAH